jgi:hypothetical protein
VFVWGWIAVDVPFTVKVNAGEELIFCEEGSETGGEEPALRVFVNEPRSDTSNVYDPVLAVADKLAERMELSETEELRELAPVAEPSCRMDALREAKTELTELRAVDCPWSVLTCALSCVTGSDAILIARVRTCCRSLEKRLVPLKRVLEVVALVLIASFQEFGAGDYCRPRTLCFHVQQINLSADHPLSRSSFQ